MGELLERPQRVCQEYGASLFVVHHFNRKHGTGRERMSGAGPAEWGRVLITATVSSRRKDPVTKATDVATRLTIVGGEIPDQALRVQRRIWSDHPDDLDSPLHLRVSVTELGEVVDGDDEPLARERDWNDPAQPPLPDDVRQYIGPRAERDPAAGAVPAGAGRRRDRCHPRRGAKGPQGAAAVHGRQADRPCTPTTP